MKKIILAGILALCVFSIHAQKAAPEFNGKNGSVIDANKVSGVFKSSLIVEDKLLDDAEMSVNVYAWYAEDWLSLGEVSLAEFDANKKIVAPKGVTLSALRYFAVESEDREIAVKAKKFEKDLVLEIRDKDSDLSKPVVPVVESNENAALFDKLTLSVECDEKLYLRNLTSRPAVGFKVSLYNSKLRQWEEFGTVIFKNLAQQTKVNGKDIGSHRYIAIEALDDEDYTYAISVAKNNDDIIIDISNPKKKKSED